MFFQFNIQVGIERANNNQFFIHIVNYSNSFCRISTGKYALKQLFKVEIDAFVSFTIALSFQFNTKVFIQKLSKYQ